MSADNFNYGLYNTTFEVKRHTLICLKVLSIQMFFPHSLKCLPDNLFLLSVFRGKWCATFSWRMWINCLHFEGWFIISFSCQKGKRRIKPVKNSDLDGKKLVIKPLLSSFELWLLTVTINQSRLNSLTPLILTRLQNSRQCSNPFRLPRHSWPLSCWQKCSY